MEFEEKLSKYKQLNFLQKRKLKKQLKYFDSLLWFVEPSIEMYGVEWTHTDLQNIISSHKN